MADLVADLEALDAELTDEVMEIDLRWMTTAKEITPVEISLERTDVSVDRLVVAWMPVS